MRILFGFKDGAEHACELLRTIIVRICVLTNRQTYKQAKERPDLIAFVVDPGWVKTRSYTETISKFLHVADFHPLVYNSYV
jgi:hypothetical protein